MPSRLASGPQTIFWWRGNVTPSKDYEKWAGLIKDLTEHLTERYGAEEVKSWYFEVWNEPNLSLGFWTGTQEDYFKLYKYSAQAIKSVNKEYRVGGKGKVLNATVLGTPEGNVVLNSLGKAKDNGVVKRIEILGSKEKISWKQNTGTGFLHPKNLYMPAHKISIGKIAEIFRISQHYPMNIRAAAKTLKISRITFRKYMADVNKFRNLYPKGKETDLHNLFLYSG